MTARTACARSGDRSARARGARIFPARRRAAPARRSRCRRGRRDAKLNEACTLDELTGWLKPKEQLAMLNDRALIAMLGRLDVNPAPEPEAKVS